MSKGSDHANTTKENILNTTLDLITTEGLENVTLRKIAASANVNLALINYHFGSKDKLVNEALKRLLASLRKLFIILDDFSMPPKERLKTFMIQFANSVLKYPALFREVLGKGDVIFESQFEYKDYMRTMGVNKIKDTLKEITGEEDSNTLSMMMVQLQAAIFFPSLMACKKNAPLVWNQIPIEAQIDFLFEHYFAKYN